MLTGDMICSIIYQQGIATKVGAMSISLPWAFDSLCQPKNCVVTSLRFLLSLVTGVKPFPLTAEKAILIAASSVFVCD